MATATTPVKGFLLDEEAFRAEHSYKLTPTNLKGAYAVPAYPDSFDPRTASQADLTRHGLMWRKPRKEDPPEMRAAWDRAFSRKWLEKDRIVPELHPQLGVTHHYRGAKPKQQTNTSYLTRSWAGAGTKTGKWTSVIGYWKVPVVTEPPEVQGTEGGWNSSSWLGLDGFFGSNDVLQAGVQQRVVLLPPFNIPISIYVAWFEWYAPPQVNSPGYIYQTNIANFPVKATDQVYCGVGYNGTTSGSITFANETNGAHFSITLAPPPGASFDGQSCEWIMEAPDGGEPTSSIPSFSPVTFTTSFACGPGNVSTNPATGDILNIETASGKVVTSTTVSTDTAVIKFIG